MSITSADAIVTLFIPDVFPVPQALEMFAVDSSFISDSVKLAESKLGIDGEMSQGKVPFILPVSISLMPDSPSIDIFNMWANYIRKQDVVLATLSITLLSTGYVYLLQRGGLTDAKLIPDGKKVLEEQSYKIDFPGKYFTAVGV